MSIAYGFDPNISPIYDDDDEDDQPGTYHSLNFSSAETPKKIGRLRNRTMGTTHLYEQSSSDFHNFHQECAPEMTSNLHEPAEEVEESELRDLCEKSDSEVSDSRNAHGDSDDEVVPDSTGFLANTVIVLSAGCCLPIRHHLSKSLIEMGAEVQKVIDHRTTHIVVDRYADEEVVGAAMSRRPHPPLMVDVKWIQECLDQRQRCEETNFSMTGLRYLRQTCRRLSSFREPSVPRRSSAENQENIEETYWEDMENDSPEDPAKLLEEIRKLSERIDALMDYAPTIRFEYHSPDCPTRRRAPSLPPVPVNAPIATTRQAGEFRRLLTSISTSTIIRRRRSFSSYCLEHREPENEVLNVIRDNRDVREIWEEPKVKRARANIPKPPKPAPRTKKGPQKTVNDMRKTMAADLTVIRTTLSRNADINRARTPKKNQKSKNSNNPPRSPLTQIQIQKQIRIAADDSDIESALASLTISSPPPEPKTKKCSRVVPDPPKESVEIIEDTRISTRKRTPLVLTKSQFINRLQTIDNEDDDFISDVSGFISKNQTSSGKKSKENDKKTEVVFTGFNKDSPIEKKLKSIVRRFKLQVAAEIDERKTLCVVSRHGKRTLVVLKAICCQIPVIRPQWLEESFEDSRLLSTEDYIFNEWNEVLQKTRRNPRVFENFRAKMWISSECVPDPKDLRWMIEKCGGKMTRHLEHAQLVIAPENWTMPDNLDPFTEVATPLFIIDSISTSELQNIREYIVEL